MMSLATVEQEFLRQNMDENKDTENGKMCLPQI